MNQYPNTIGMKVTKASGKQEEFKKSKFCISLNKAGVPKNIAKYVCDEISKELTPGISTADVIKIASRHLRKKSPGLAVSYNLRRGVMYLGPAGFLFEKYVEAILKEYGYKTKRNQIMKGECVSHEIDVVAQKEDVHYLIEAKYRNDPKLKTDITVAMYAYARLQDIVPVQKKKEVNGSKHKMWLFTNAKFTSTAIKYGKCRGIKMTGWNYPTGSGKSLEDLIRGKMLFPITALPSVNHFSREQFARHNLMLVKDVISFNAKDLQRQFGIRSPRAKDIIEEAHSLYAIKEN